MRTLLQKIYTDADANTVIDGIEELTATYRERLDPQIKPRPLSERDAMLITYGDTLTDDGRPPLQVLHGFHKQHLIGVFELTHILPFHPYSSDDGFSVIDYFAVREDLGDWNDVSSFARDCRLMTDAVINHISSASEWFRRYLDDDPDYVNYFIDCDPKADLASVVRPRTTPLLSEYEDHSGKVRHIWTTFSRDQVDINYANPRVLLAIVEVLFYLVSKGARLLRLDAVTFLWKEPGSSSANLPQTHAIIKLLRKAVSDLCPDVVIVTETNVPHHENIAYFGNGHDEAHMVYNFALPPLVAYSLINGHGAHLTEWASALAVPGDDACFLNFTASHDGVGVRPVEQILGADELDTLVAAATSAGGQVSYRSIGGEDKPYELNCTYLDLITPPDESVDTTVNRFLASQAIALSMPGVPAVYIQSLLGTHNDIEGVRATGRARSINRSQHKLADIEAALADKASLTARVFSRLKHLITVRGRESSFSPYAAFEVIDAGPDTFVIYRIADDSTGILAMVNLTNKDVSVSLPGFEEAVEVLSNVKRNPNDLTLDPYEVVWIRCGRK